MVCMLGDAYAMILFLVRSENVNIIAVEQKIEVVFSLVVSD